MTGGSTPTGVPAISIVVVAIGPERLVDRAIETATGQSTPSAELVIVHDRDDEAARARFDACLSLHPATLVAVDGTSPGAARNAGVRSSAGACFLVVDGSEALPSDYASSALQALHATPNAAFAAAPGGPLFGVVSTSRESDGRVDGARLVGSAWSVGPAAVRREAFERVGGFDESLPALADWDLLLALTDAGMNGVTISRSGSRYSQDDVRLRESLGARSHLPAMRRIFTRHQRAFEASMRSTLVERERTIKTLFEYERSLLTRRAQALAELNTALEQLSALKPALRKHGLRSLDLADLRRTSPVSRNWGSDRGVPVDRHYIHRFLAEHADDVRGHVLEMLDGDLTAAYGQDRVQRSDVLDIDPGNARATVIADLRMAGQMPADAYDCFILTQTLHLIDDMPAALRSAWRALRPGGVLLVTLPCASMVAVEYGPRGDHWRVTEAGARALFERVFSPADLTIRAHGNVLTTTAFLYGLCCDDLDPEEFAVDDPAYPLIITVRAQKPAATIATKPPAARPAAAVLLYHRVARVERDTHALAVSPEAFRSQIEYLRDRWLVLPLRELSAAAADGELPGRAIALTFDDGYLDNLEIAAPILRELGVPATFFLTSEPLHVARRFWWDTLDEMLLGDSACPDSIEVRTPGRRFSCETATVAARRAAHDELYGMFKASAPVVRDDMLAQLARQIPTSMPTDSQRPMVAEEVRRLQQYPLIEIGAHGVHHLSLPHLSPDDCHREVFESRSALERVTGCPVTSFAYPFGDLSPESIVAVMTAGFDAAVSCEVRGLRARDHRLRIPRLPTREESGADLGDRLARTLLGGDDDSI